MTDADMVEHVSRYCRVPIIDYARRESSGLLVGSGTGLMMAIMDQAQTFRWCIDLDVLDEQSRWEDWMLLVRAFVRPMAVVGWFSITRPQRLAAVVRRLRPAPGVYAAGVSAPDPFDDCEVRLQSVEQFIGWAAQAERPAPRDRVVEGARVTQVQSVGTFKPSAHGSCHNGIEVNDAENDAARQSGHVVGRHEVDVMRLAGGSVNQHRSSICCAPRAVLDVFASESWVPRDDERGPRLSDGQDTQVHRFAFGGSGNPCRV
jgi:hypothetical protein